MTALEEAIKAAGGPLKLAKALDMTRQGLAKWDRVPAERVLDVEKATGVPRERLRPDLYKGFQRVA